MLDRNGLPGLSDKTREALMKSIRVGLVALIMMASGLAIPVSATSWSTDQSDLWWNSSENGWGIQFVQRGSTMFATIFVYDAAGNPTWYVATMPGTKANGVLTFTGDLYSTGGAWFGAVPYNPAAFTVAKVGTMTWQVQPPMPGTLTYSVNGVNVTKVLTRQPISSDDYSGAYFAGFHIIVSGCANAAKNGIVDAGGTLTIAQNGSAVSLNLTAGGNSCTFSGPNSPSGQFGNIAGTYSCSDGDAGTFSASDMIVTPFAIAARLSLASTTTGCQDTGQIGGVRTDQ